MSKQVFPASQPRTLSTHDALRIVRELAARSENVAVIPHGRKRKHERCISHADILRVLRRGVCVEGPYIAAKSGLWRLNVEGRSAGELLTCVVEIVWRKKLLVVTAF
jgi:hypothetical protein